MVLGPAPLNALLLPKLNGKSNIAGSLTSYLSSILFNWGGKINHEQRTTARQDLPHISAFMHALHERTPLLFCLLAPCL